MMLLPCVYCGPRNADEFVYAGEELDQPDPGTTQPTEWRRFLYMRANLADWTVEHWYHQAGCRRYFTLERHTVRNEIRASRRPAASPWPGDGESGQSPDAQSGS
jgi:heterotetrameric sarcosine oxidase delta subunit